MDNNIMCAFMYFILCSISCVSFIIFLLYVVFLYKKKENRE